MIAQQTPCMHSGTSRVLRPSGSWLWSQSWRDLLFCHWEVPAGCLQQLLPQRLEPDTFAGMGWVSVVAFRLTGVRRRGLPALPPWNSFAELNLRTYVTYRGEPAIYFLSIHAGKRSVVRLVRWFTPLPYRFASIRYARGPDRFRFHSSCSAGRAPVIFDAAFLPATAEHAACPGSLDAWLLERYCLYAADKRGRLFRTLAQHLPWQYCNPTVAVAANTLGYPFGLDLARAPDVSHFSSGVRAQIWPFGH